jgi:hypothetical protein
VRGVRKDHQRRRSRYALERTTFKDLRKNKYSMEKMHVSQVKSCEEVLAALIRSTKGNVKAGIRLQPNKKVDFRVK